MSVQILVGDCHIRIKELPDASVDSVVCDPPYHLTNTGVGLALKMHGANGERGGLKKEKRYAERGFMGQTWDGGDVAFQPETWAEVLRVLKPGGHLVAFSGTRTYHRMVCAIEDAGFEIRDQLAWVYGSGFPKSLDVSKAIDKAAGAEREVIGPGRWNSVKGSNDRQAGCLIRPGGKHDETAPATEAAKQWQGWGTALKPSWEPICLARRPLGGSVAQNVLTHGTGALNIDGCRIGLSDGDQKSEGGRVLGEGRKRGSEYALSAGNPDDGKGRWPANLCHDGSDEVLAGFPDVHGAGAAREAIREAAPSGMWGLPGDGQRFGDSGSAARFFYCAKADTAERGDKNSHPTVKPIALMRWLCRLVTPVGGTILDPFAGSGSTLIAADAEQFNAIGIEMNADYAAIAEARVREAAGLFADVRAA